MRIGIAAFVLCLVICAGPDAASARAGLEGDASLSAGSEPVRDFGSTTGIGIGLNIHSSRLERLDLGGHEKSMMLRPDLFHYEWSERFPARGTRSKVTIRRLPLFLGARYFYPAADRLRLFGEAGLELSFDRTKVEGVAGSTSDSDINAGIAFGVGADYSWPGGFFAGGNLRLHAITDSFVSLSAFVGKRFR